MRDVLRLIGLRLPGVAGVLRGFGWMVGEVTAAELATIPCDAPRRGEERRREGAAGAADEKVICEKDAADAYAWNNTTDRVATASNTVAGKVELATTAETTTGTDATRAVTPDGLHDMTSLAGAAWFLDDDAMTANDATKVPSQQSVKAYVDANAGGGTFWVPFMVRSVASDVVWTNMPAAQTEAFAVTLATNRLVDLSGMTEVLFAIRTGASGTYVAGAFLDIQYSTNLTTPSWTDFNLNLQFGTASSIWTNTGWVSVPVGAQGLVLLRLVGEAGNGTADPTFDTAGAQFRA